MVIATNIKWDCDNIEDLFGLPGAIEIPEGITSEEEISDYITAETGFCHNGFELIKNGTRYYAVEFGLRAEVENNDFCGTPDRHSICIIGECMPTIEQAEDFLRTEMVFWGYDCVTAVKQISHEEAYGEFYVSEFTRRYTGEKKRSDGKYDYFLPEQLNNCYKFVGLLGKNANDLTYKEQVQELAKLTDLFQWVEHPDYVRLIPKHIATGTLITHNIVPVTKPFKVCINLNRYSCMVPPITMTIQVPTCVEPEEYIDDYLNRMLADKHYYFMVWRFVE